MTRHAEPSDFFPIFVILVIFGLIVIAYGWWINRTGDLTLLPGSFQSLIQEEDTVRRLGRYSMGIGGIIVVTTVVAFIATGMPFPQ